MESPLICQTAGLPLLFCSYHAGRETTVMRPRLLLQYSAILAFIWANAHSYYFVQHEVF